MGAGLEKRCQSNSGLQVEHKTFLLWKAKSPHEDTETEV